MLGCAPLPQSSLAEVTTASYFSSLPLIPGDAILDRAGIFSTGAPSSIHIVVNAGVVTGQNPQSTLSAVQNMILLANQRWCLITFSLNSSLFLFISLFYMRRLRFVGKSFYHVCRNYDLYSNLFLCTCEPVRKHPWEEIITRSSTVQGNVLWVVLYYWLGCMKDWVTFITKAKIKIRCNESVRNTQWD